MSFSTRASSKWTRKSKASKAKVEEIKEDPGKGPRHRGSQARRARKGCPPLRNGRPRGTDERSREEIRRKTCSCASRSSRLRTKKSSTSAPKDILATSIQRLASSTASDLMTTTVSIPNNEIKGKIIGKEGRNIRSFERAAGVELIVDDTPGSIVISSFDPIRRQVARLALENLILDGRIQPAKIEELVDKAREEINKIIKEKGEQAVYECGIFNFDPRIVAIIGRLYFRTSYGQNVLQHSIEMSHIAGMIAEELGADVAIAKAGALVHDIGKGSRP
ncbi:MAG: HDIG domain-containing metalloprotein [bacterium]